MLPDLEKSKYYLKVEKNGRLLDTENIVRSGGLTSRPLKLKF